MTKLLASQLIEGNVQLSTEQKNIKENYETCICTSLQRTNKEFYDLNFKKHSRMRVFIRAFVWGCLYECGLSFNPDRTHSVSVEIIGD